MSLDSYKMAFGWIITVKSYVVMNDSNMVV